MSDTPNPIQVQKYLGGIDYPASRQTICDAAREAGAPADVVDALEAIPDREYEGPTGVSEAVSGR